MLIHTKIWARGIHLKSHHHAFETSQSLCLCVAGQQRMTASCPGCTLPPPRWQLGKPPAPCDFEQDEAPFENSLNGWWFQLVYFFFLDPSLILVYSFLVREDMACFFHVSFLMKYPVHRNIPHAEVCSMTFKCLKTNACHLFQAKLITAAWNYNLCQHHD